MKKPNNLKRPLRTPSWFVMSRIAAQRSQQTLNEIWRRLGRAPSDMKPDFERS